MKDYVEVNKKDTILNYISNDENIKLDEYVFVDFEQYDMYDMKTLDLNELKETIKNDNIKLFVYKEI